MCGIRNVDSISVFSSASAKLVELLKKTIFEIKLKGNEGREAGESYKKNKLKEFCATWWIERHVCIKTFDNLLLPIAQCLHTL